MYAQVDEKIEEEMDIIEVLKDLREIRQALKTLKDPAKNNSQMAILDISSSESFDSSTPDPHLAIKAKDAHSLTSLFKGLALLKKKPNKALLVDSTQTEMALS